MRENKPFAVRYRVFNVNRYKTIRYSLRFNTLEECITHLVNRALGLETVPEMEPVPAVTGGEPLYIIEYYKSIKNRNKVKRMYPIENGVVVRQKNVRVN